MKQQFEEAITDFTEASQHDHEQMTAGDRALNIEPLLSYDVSSPAGSTIATRPWIARRSPVVHPIVLLAA